MTHMLETMPGAPRPDAEALAPTASALSRRQLLMGAASGALLAGCGGGGDSAAPEAAAPAAHGGTMAAAASPAGSLGYVQCATPADKVIIPGVRFSSLGSVLIAICRVRKDDLDHHNGRIPIVQSADANGAPGCGLDVMGALAGTAAGCVARMRWRRSDGAAVAASYLNGKGLGAPFKAKGASVGDRWVALVARITGDADMPVEELFVTNQFKQPRNSIFMYWSPLPGRATWSSGALQPGHGNAAADAADGPLAISSASALGSLDLQITSVRRSADSGCTVMQVARVIKVDARRAPNSSVPVAAPLTHHQIEQLIAGYTPADLGLAADSNDVWIDMTGPDPLVNRIGSPDFNGRVEGQPTFAADPQAFGAITA